MATGALNVFRTVSGVVPTSASVVYEAPTGYSSIILMAQISNTASATANVTFSHVKGSTVTELIKDYEVPTRDAASAVTGKLVLQTGEKISISASSANNLKFVLSILESANE
jgi:hypothetical protein